MTSSELGATIRETRWAAGLSQWDLARRSGVSRATIARLELGQDVTVAKLTQVASSLGLRLKLGVGEVPRSVPKDQAVEPSARA